MNTTTVTIWLDSWGDGGCGIVNFAVEYRIAYQGAWVEAAKNIQPTKRIYSISSLLPGTEYELKITASNNAGDTVAVYNFTTYTLAGGK